MFNVFKVGKSLRVLKVLLKTVFFQFLTFCKVLDVFEKNFASCSFEKLFGRKKSFWCVKRVGKFSRFEIFMKMY